MARRMSREANTGAYQMEHWLAWLMAALAIGLTIVGLLVGFDIINIRSNAGLFAEARAARDFDESLLWLLTAVGAAVLSVALHQTEHHRAAMATSEVENPEAGLFNLEHYSAWLFAAVATAGGVFGILTGYDVWGGGYTVRDGELWIIGGIVASVLTLTLHTVRHHQLAATEEDVIVRIVEERTGGRAAPGMARERVSEPRRETQ